MLVVVLLASVVWLFWEIFSFVVRSNEAEETNPDWWEALKNCPHRRLIIPVCGCGCGCGCIYVYGCVSVVVVASQGCCLLFSQDLKSYHLLPLTLAFPFPFNIHKNTAKLRARSPRTRHPLPLDDGKSAYRPMLIHIYVFFMCPLIRMSGPIAIPLLPPAWAISTTRQIPACPDTNTHTHTHTPTHTHTHRPQPMP